MLPVTAGSRLAVWDGDHGLHRYDHPRLEDRFDVLSELHPGLPAVVVAEYPEAVAVAERPVFQ